MTGKKDVTGQPDLSMGRRHFMGAMAASAMGLACMPRMTWGAPVSNRKTNVLFIAVDDLRPELGCYGRSHIHSPNIDRLAARGTRFNRAYCNVPVCGPSRLNVLTGLRVGDRPWSTRGVNRPYVSLPAYLGEHGYHTICNGKVLHHMRDSQDDWSEAPWRSVAVYHGEHDWAGYNHYEQWQNAASGEHLHPETGRGPYCEQADVPDDAYQDGKVAEKAIADLRRMADADEPFFLACGFWRPHLPFNAPSRYWDLYDRETIPLADNRHRPENLPDPVQSSNEINGYGRVADRKATEAFHREARHGYFASVSYVDAQIGRLLSALEELGLAKNTAIVLWADHGFHLGEHDFWGKHNTMQHSLHVPLIVCPPGQQTGNASDALVENVDIYPTVCELLGLPVPGHVEGESVVPLLSEPDRPWKSAIFSQWQGAEAVKTDRYLYSEWRDGDDVRHRMLFDHEKDPQENVNVADDPAMAEVVAEHSELLQRGWQAATARL